MRKKPLLIGLVSALGIVLLCLNIYAADDIRKVPVHFKKGASQAIIQGHIKGRETIDYVLRAQSGQTMTVDLKTSNTAAYFNVLPPGSDNEALFIGQTSGSHFQGKLPKDGDYSIRVYLVRAAARRHETANYTLTVKITGHETDDAGKAVEHQGQAFDRTLSLLGISFQVTSSNVPSGNSVTITPSGLQIDNQPISRPVNGVVTGAEVADLNIDQSPEIYVYVRESGPEAHGSLVAYSANNKKSLSEIYLPPLTQAKGATADYRGHDEMAVVESVFVRRFPIYGQDGSTPTGKIRQLQYKLRPGEAGWVLQLDKTVEY